MNNFFNYVNEYIQLPSRNDDYILDEGSNDVIVNFMLFYDFRTTIKSSIKNDFLFLQNGNLRRIEGFINI